MCEQGGSARVDQRRLWAYYQNHAPHVFASNEERLDYIVKRVGRLFRQSNPRILTVGAGNGYLEKACTARGWDVHCLDLDSVSMVPLARLGVKAVCGLLQRVPLKDASCDVVIASEVLEHLADRDRADGLSEVRRVLRPGGYFVGTVPYKEVLAESVVLCPGCGAVFHRWGHQACFDSQSLTEELQRHFRRVRVRRTAFVSFRRRSLLGKLKGAVRVILAKCGSRVAIPGLLFLAQR